MMISNRLHNYQYPLDEKALRSFRSYFHGQYGQTLFYVSDSFIQSTFLEFSHARDHDDSIANLTTSLSLDVIAMCEDLHASLHQQHLFTRDQLSKQKPCLSCKQTGVDWTDGSICRFCLGTAKVAKRKRSPK